MPAMTLRSILLSLLVAIALGPTGWRAAPASAADPPTDPVLRIDGGEHAAVILGLPVSADGSRLATAAHDRRRHPGLPPRRLQPGVRGPRLHGDQHLDRVR